MYCKSCSYPLNDLSEGKCPECGRSFDPAQSRTFRRRPPRRRLTTVVLLTFILVVGGLTYWRFAVLKQDTSILQTLSLMTVWERHLENRIQLVHSKGDANKIDPITAKTEVMVLEMRIKNATARMDELKREAIMVFFGLR